MPLTEEVTKTSAIIDNSDHKKKMQHRIKSVENDQKRLYKAIQQIDLPSVFDTIENNLDINFQNPEDDQKTYLHVATKHKHPVLVALLLGKGADITLRDASGKTPLHLALESGNQEIISLIANKTLSSLEEIRERNDLILNQVQSRQNGTNSFKHRTPSRSNEELLQSYISLASRSDRDGVIRDDLASTQKTSQDVARTNLQLEKIFKASRQPEIPRAKSFTESSGEELEKVLECHYKRKSPMTEMLKISHFQTIHNIFVAVFLISLLNIIVYNFYEKGNIVDLSLFRWCFAYFPSAMFIWSIMWVVSFSSYFIEKGMAQRVLSPTIGYAIYAIVASTMLLVVPIYIRELDFPPATASFVMGELVRLIMKKHSYLMVNRLLRIDYQKRSMSQSVTPKKESGASEEQKEHYPENVTLSNYFMFLWYPTLVYQLNYPRKKTINWNFVFGRFFEFSLCIVYVYAIFTRYIQPYGREMAGSYSELFLGIFKIMMPGIILSLLMFYMVLHSWLNAFAELTRFGDRHFYSDWWNVTNWASYYRRWNYVVHHFLHRHLFLDTIANFHTSRITAMFFTFIFSAVVHEYIIAVCLGFYKPVLFILFAVPGIFFIWLTKLMRDSRWSNVFFWAMMIMGHGIMIGLYYRQWILYQTDPNHGHKGLLSLIWII